MNTADVMGCPAQSNHVLNQTGINFRTLSDERGITLNDFNVLSMEPSNSNRESVLQE
jgi:hypothetical protein